MYVVDITKRTYNPFVFNNVVKLDPQERGKESEDRVERALVNLIVDNKIVGFTRTKQHGPVDSVGIDFIVHFRGFDVPLQVKSSNKAAKLWKSKATRKHIPVVNGQLGNLERRIMFVLMLTLFSEVLEGGRISEDERVIEKVRPQYGA